MKIDILRKRVGVAITAFHILASALPFGMLVNQYDVVSNIPVNPYSQMPVIERVDAEYITYLGYKEPEPVVETKPIKTQKPVATHKPVVTSRSNISRTLTCVVSAYCGENYPHICNNGDATTTATGTTPTAGRTIAVDPTVIPYGAEVIIEGHTYIAEDCGGAIKGNRIDLFFSTHEEALAWGKQTKEVIINN